MYLVAVIVISCAITVHTKSVEEAYEQPPSQLHGDQPEDNSFEVRQYNASKWASTNVTTFSEYEAAEIGYGRLHKYINGDNIGNVKIRTTVPVTVTVYKGECVYCARRFTVSLYLPPIYQDDTPEPNSPYIFIETKPDTIVYKRSFKGPKPIRFLYEANLLYRHLANNSISTVADDVMIFATYNPPFKMFKSINEVWLVSSENFQEEEEEEYYYYVESEEKS